MDKIQGPAKQVKFFRKSWNSEWQQIPDPVIDTMKSRRIPSYTTEAQQLSGICGCWLTHIPYVQNYYVTVYQKTWATKWYADINVYFLDGNWATYRIIQSKYYPLGPFAKKKKFFLHQIFHIWKSSETWMKHWEPLSPGSTNLSIKPRSTTSILPWVQMTGEALGGAQMKPEVLVWKRFR